MTAGRNGWLDNVRHLPSANFDARPDTAEIDLLVIHCISLPPGCYGGDEIDALFCNRLDCSAHPYFAALEELRVSAHFLVARDGGITQYVSSRDRAWHAGVSTWRGRTGCNDFSIGIELEGTDSSAFDDRQYRSLVELTLVLQQHYPALTRSRICGHSDIAPGRKADPGTGFDWQRYLNGLLEGSA